MAYSDTLNLVVGDTLPELTLRLKDKNTAASGAVLDEDNSDTCLLYTSDAADE